jgi:hypothetical protein
MAEQQAKVTSVDAIELFRSTLLQFLSKARPTLEEIISEVNRTRNWLQHDQTTFWEREMKVRQRAMEQAQSELFSARISTIHNASAAQQMAVQRARRAIREAEEKLRILKKWGREIDNRTDPFVKEIEQLHGFISVDMTKAVAYLTEIIKSLEAYADVMHSVAPAAPPPPVAEPQSDAEKPSS